jgi:3-deoxy-manno-octulosonate cytidylyltransferase (CMP-KDO synthetase)
VTAAPEPVVAVIIPARYSSTRFPGKPLCRFQGSDGVSRTLIEHSWRAAIEVPGVSFVAVATDDDRIAREVEKFGGVAIMTPSDCRNGTERCAAALSQLDPDVEYVVNLQGDAPLTPATFVTSLVERLMDDPSLPMATPAIRCTPLTYRHLAGDAAEGRVGGTTVVFNRSHDALYFSKRIIPFANWDRAAEETPAAFLHLGIYAYRPSALAAYMEAGVGDLEEGEGLEQLRFLEAGMRVGIAVCDAPDWEVVEVNNPGDVAVVEGILRGRRGH